MFARIANGFAFREVGFIGKRKARSSPIERGFCGLQSLIYKSFCFYTHSHWQKSILIETLSAESEGSESGVSVTSNVSAVNVIV